MKMSPVVRINYHSQLMTVGFGGRPRKIEFVKCCRSIKTRKKRAADLGIEFLVRHGPVMGFIEKNRVTFA